MNKLQFLSQTVCHPRTIHYNEYKFIYVKETYRKVRVYMTLILLRNTGEYLVQRYRKSLSTYKKVCEK